MKTLIVYDNSGFILFTETGSNLREPVGVPFLWTDIPEKKYAKSVDVKANPHQVVYGDMPPSEVDQLRLEMARSNSELFETMILLTGGGF